MLLMTAVDRPRDAGVTDRCAPAVSFELRAPFPQKRASSDISIGQPPRRAVPETRVAARFSG
jgi:hypothetical protein